MWYQNTSGLQFTSFLTTFICFDFELVSTKLINSPCEKPTNWIYANKYKVGAPIMDIGILWTPPPKKVWSSSIILNFCQSMWKTYKSNFKTNLESFTSLYLINHINNKHFHLQPLPSSLKFSHHLLLVLWHFPNLLSEFSWD